MTTETVSAPPPSTKSQVLRSFDVTDFPALTGLEEEWRFTPLKRLGELVTATKVAGATPVVEHDELPEGVVVTPAGAAEPVLTPFDRISALAFSSAVGVTLVEVDAEVEADRPVLLRVIGQGAEAAATRTLLKKKEKYYIG